MKVLIVDDSPVMRILIRRTIEEHNPDETVEITEACDGEEALGKVSGTNFDLVMLDWNMPVLDGLSFVKKVRGDGLDLPIIMISAVSDESSIFDACEAGVTDYIEKPVRPTDLAERIRPYLP